METVQLPSSAAEAGQKLQAEGPEADEVDVKVEGVCGVGQQRCHLTRQLGPGGVFHRGVDVRVDEEDEIETLREHEEHEEKGRSENHGSEGPLPPPLSGTSGAGTRHQTPATLTGLPQELDRHRVQTEQRHQGQGNAEDGHEPGPHARAVVGHLTNYSAIASRRRDAARYEGRVQTEEQQQHQDADAVDSGLAKESNPSVRGGVHQGVRAFRGDDHEKPVGVQAEKVRENQATAEMDRERVQREGQLVEDQLRHQGGTVARCQQR